jgi:hypothetical protein
VKATRSNVRLQAQSKLTSTPDPTPDSSPTGPNFDYSDVSNIDTEVLDSSANTNIVSIVNSDVSSQSLDTSTDQTTFRSAESPDSGSSQSEFLRQEFGLGSQEPPRISPLPIQAPTPPLPSVVEESDHQSPSVADETIVPLPSVVEQTAVESEPSKNPQATVPQLVSTSFVPYSYCEA